MPTLLTSGLVIDHLRFRVHNERILRRAIVEGKLKLSGLTKLAMDARANIDGLTADYRVFNEKASSHRTDVRGLTEQIGEMDSDLSSSVNILGNSVANSNNGAEKQVIKPVDVGEVPAAVLQPEAAKTAPPVITGLVGFDMRPGGVNRIDEPAQGVQIVGDQRHFDRIG